MSHKYNENRYNSGFAGYPFTQSLSDSLTAADSTVTLTVGKGLSETVSFSESLTKAVTVLKAETITVSESTGKDVTTVLLDSVGLVESRSSEPGKQFNEGILLGDHLLTIEAELSDTVRLEDWISLHLMKPGVWTEDSTPSGSWTEASPPADPSWTNDAPPSDDPWSH